MAKQLNNDMEHMEMGTSPENDKAYDSLKSKQRGSAKANSVLKGAGYCSGGSGYARGGKVHKDEAQDKKLIKKELSKTKLEVKKHGGKVEGKHVKHRADKYVRGGSVPKGKHTVVNVNMGASQADKQMAAQQGMKMGAQMAMQKMAGAQRPGAGAPMQARPPGAPMAPQAPGGMPQGGVNPTIAGQKRGGRTYAKGGKVGPVRLKGAPHLDGGSGGALGRLNKIKSYGTKPKS